MTGYVLGAWTGFAAAQVGAAAALTGLLFVAVSINLERILSYPKLPARAAETLTILLLALVVATLMLVPQSVRLLGVEVAVLAAATGATTLAIQIRHGPDDPTDPRLWYASRIAAIQLVTASYLIGGTSSAVQVGGGLYWFVPGGILAFTGAAYNAWVLLVEIIRQKPANA